MPFRRPHNRLNRASTTCALPGLEFVPSKDWGTPEVFRYWRYDTVRRYINTMVDAIRSTGGNQPIAYSGFHSSQPQSDVEQAIADSRCNAITTWAYRGGLESEPRADTLNVLPNLGNWDLSARYPDKARLVYEFDAPGRATSASVYPALARHWRSAGVQVACQFQYDPTALAHLNWNWPTHYLHLRHTPEKMVSFIIGREVFRRLARGVSFQTPDDDQIFPPAAVSFHRNVSLLCAEDCYMQSQPTDWRPLPLPQNPSWIVSVGTCPYFE